MTEPTVDTPVVDPLLDDDDNIPEPTELESLQARADLMNLKYDKRLGLEKMRELVNTAVLAETPPLPNLEEPVVETPVVNTAVTVDQLAAAISAVPEVPQVETLSEKRYRLKQEARKLVRVHIMNMNPARKDWECETYSVGNNFIGNITRVVPFNTDWHIEQALLNALQERECTIFREKKDQSTGQMVKRMVKIKELQIAVLPPLTEKEIRELAQRQAMAAGTETDEDEV